MAGILERFWQPMPKDIAGGLIIQSRWQERNNLTPAAAVLLQASSAPCPPNTLRVVQNIALSATPGAAQTVAILSVAWSSGVSTFRIATNAPVGYPAATRLDIPMNLGEGIWLRPGEVLLFSATFNAGAASNDGNVFYNGYDIPVGNLQ
jgi:hypothetical protein